MVLRSTATWATALVLCAACGGGGGGGSDGPNVTVTVTSPVRVDASLYQGASAPSVVISGRFSGDVAALNGQTVYLIAVVTHGFLFDATPTVYLDSDGLGGNLQLFGGAPLTDVAIYSGTIQLRVCLDASCQQELQVVNGEIPYAIQVKRGLSFETAQPVLSTTFGTAPAPAIVAVILPDDVVTWRVNPPGYGMEGQVLVEKALDGSARVVVSARELMLPGSVTQGTSVSAETASGTTLTKSLTVTYSTSASSEPFAFRRPSVELSVPKDSQYLTASVPADALLPGGDSDRFDHVGTTYEWPPEADANPRRNRWLYAYYLLAGASPRRPTTTYPAEFRAQNCYTRYDSTLSQSVTDCLPPGHYTATVLYRYSPVGGTAVDVSFPVTLDVTP
jgi:hypothetical protein